jgi:hypothetical protein
VPQRFGGVIGDHSSDDRRRRRRPLANKLSQHLGRHRILDEESAKAVTVDLSHAGFHGWSAAHRHAPCHLSSTQARQRPVGRGGDHNALEKAGGRWPTRLAAASSDSGVYVPVSAMVPGEGRLRLNARTAGEVPNRSYSPL